MTNKKGNERERKKGRIREEGSKEKREGRKEELMTRATKDTDGTMSEVIY